MPDPTPTTADLIAQLEAREAALTAARGEPVLTSDASVATVSSMATSAQRRAAGKAARNRISCPAVAAFEKKISDPHAGGSGFTINALAEKLNVSHTYLPSVLRKRFKIRKAYAKRVFELTGYQFPEDMIG